MSLFHDWRNQISYGRFCAAMCLVMAIVREFQGADITHVSLWLGKGLFTYGLSKGTEAICDKGGVNG